MPILSICIPTYNRSKVLDKTLFYLTNEKVFLDTDDVEIVISNNNSSDNTDEICQKYLNKFPTKIKYKKQQTNIIDKNFIEVLKQADGKYIKLQNDKNYFVQGELEKLIFFLKNENPEKIIYFENEKNEGIYNCSSMEEFFQTKPILITWINSFCCLNEIFHEIIEPERFCDMKFAQVDILIRLLAKYKKITVYSKTIFIIQKADNYGGYNFAKVFGNNLLTILNTLIQEKYLILSKNTYENFQKELLIKQINPFYFDVKYKFKYVKNGYFKYLYKFYGSKFYFYIDYLKWSFLKIIYFYKIYKKFFKTPQIYSYKQFNIKNIINIVLIILLIVYINYIVNPFNIFDHEILPETFLKANSKIQERLTKPIGLKFDNRKINAIFIGSSRVDFCIDKKDYKALTGKEMENLAIDNIAPHEIIEMINLARRIHPEIKEIFIGFDFESFRFIKGINDNRAKITKNKNLEISELYTALLSVKTIGTSFWTIFKNITSCKKRTYYSSGVKCLFKNKDIAKEFQDTIQEYKTRYSLYEINEIEFDTLIYYLKELQSENIKVKIFIMPTHITLQKLRYDYNLTEKYNYIRELLVQDFDIYDFDYPNEYTKEKISPDMQYFFDGSHATHMLSKLIISDLISDKQVFARKITKENIYEMNKLYEKELKNYGVCKNL